MAFPGIDIVVSPFLEAERRQYRFPRSKKRRIRRKWAKDPRNWKTFEPMIMFGPGRMYTTHEGLAGIRKSLCESTGIPERILWPDGRFPATGVARMMLPPPDEWRMAALHNATRAEYLALIPQFGALVFLDDEHREMEPPWPS